MVYFASRSGVCGGTREGLPLSPYIML